MKLRQDTSPDYSLGLSAEAADHPDGMSNTETVNRTVYRAAKHSDAKAITQVGNLYVKEYFTIYKLPAELPLMYINIYTLSQGSLQPSKSSKANQRQKN